MPLRVLLVSPLPNLDPFNGDVVYTSSLLSHPPADVEYITYADALHSGELVEHGRREAISLASNIPAAGIEVSRLLRNKLINIAREGRLLFREPFRHFEIRGRFDLVHCHTFSVRWTGRRCALVVSNALPIEELYIKARAWPPLKVMMATRVDRALARMMHVDYTASQLKRVNTIIAFTEKLRSWYIEQGVDPSRVSVAPCSPGAISVQGERRVPGRVGFVARDFMAKGGDTLLRAWPAVASRRPELSLVVAGTEWKTDLLDDSRISWLGSVSRDQLLREVLPTFDVLAYPSHFDGLPLVLLESLGFGIPVVVSDYFALPEVLGPDRRAGRTIHEGDHEGLAQAIIELLDPDNRFRAAIAARGRYESVYAPGPATEQLSIAYERALANFSHKRR